MGLTDDNPVCHIIAGPNGAGKTTFALRYLPRIVACENFVNADLIAQGLSPLKPELAQLAAGKLLLREIDTFIMRREDFAFETTLSGKTYLPKIQSWREAGWRVELIYLWLPDANFSTHRVAERVSQGGHDIPRDAILRRFPRSLGNLRDYMDCCDYTFCFDNSGDIPLPIFVKDDGGLRINDKRRFDKVKGFWSYE